MDQDGMIPQDTDFFYPFLDPENFNTLSDGELPKLDAFNSRAFGLGDCSAWLSGADGGSENGGIPSNP